MKYKEYIDLGFIRTEIHDSVEYKESGYYGFCLGFELSDKLSISVSYGELDKPKLYIKKCDGERYHIILITGEMVKDLISKPSVENNH